MKAYFLEGNSHQVQTIVPTDLIPPFKIRAHDMLTINLPYLLFICKREREMGEQTDR